MKKLFCLLLTIIMLVAVFCIPVAYAETMPVSESNTGGNSAEALLPDKYMQLNSPSIVSVDGTTVAVSNGQQLFIYKPSGNKYIDIKDANGTPLEGTTTQMIIINDYVLLLQKNVTTNSLYLCNTASSTPYFKDAKPSEITSIKSISKSNGYFTVINNSSIYNCKPVDDTLAVDSTITINIGDTEAIKTKIFADKVYLYDHSTNTLHKLDDNYSITENSDILTAELQDFVINGNDIYYLNNNTIYKQTIGATDNTYKQLESTIKNIDICNNIIYLTSYSTHQVIELDLALNKVSYYGDKGDSLDRLNTPLKVNYYLEKVYIADSENQRIIVYDQASNKREEIKTKGITPVEAVKTDSELYVLSNQKLYKQTGDGFTHIEKYVGIKNIERYGDKLAIMTNNQILFSDDSHSLDIIANDFIIPYGTNRMYVLSGDNIIKYDLESRLEIGRYESPNANGLHTIDYYGNLFITADNVITKYALEDNKYVEKSSIATNLKQNDINCTLNTYNGNMYLTSKKDHLLYRVSSQALNSTSILNNSYEHPTSYDLLQVANVETDNAYTFITPNNSESARQIAKGTKVLILTNIDIDGIKYSYITYEHSGEKEYIKSSDLTTPTSHIDMDNLAISPLLNDTNVYQYPHDKANILTALDTTDVVKATVRIASENVWNWYQIKFTRDGNETIGYVKANHFAEVTSTTPPQKVIFLTTKSKNVGEKIKMYAEADENSEVLFSDIDDGISIQIFGEYDKDSKFTKVLYNEKVGYILTENLQKDGLTPSQIIAISVSCISVVAFILIIILLQQKKKNQKPKDIEEPNLMQ